MKKRLLIVAMCLTCFTMLDAQKLKYDASRFEQFPKYSEVVEYFLTYYHIRNKESYALVKFEKRMDGWHVAEYDPANLYKPSITYHFWSYELDDYQDFKPKYSGPIRNNESGIVNQAAKTSFLRSYGARYFKISPLYGYKGYEKDLITLLGKEKNLSSDLKYMLTRAYSSYSFKELLPTSGLSKDYATSFDVKRIPDEVFQQVESNAQEQFKVYDDLIKEDPDYSTILGNVRMKYWSEFVSYYFQYKMYGRPDLGKPYLKEKIYDEHAIAYAKNILKSCKKDGILFTYGDNDTYPLIYVQDKLGFRKDVLVINTSLANAPLYINYLYREFDDDIHTTLERDFYTKSGYQYSIWKNEINFEYSLKTYLNDIKKDSKVYRMQSDGQYYFPSVYAVIAPNESNIEKQFGKLNIAPEDVKIDVSKMSYLSLGQLFMMDLIATNDWKRPIYFTVGNTLNSMLQLREYTSDLGLVLQLMPYEKDPYHYADDKAYDLIMKEFDHPIPADYHLAVENTSLTYTQLINSFETILRGAERDENNDRLIKVLNTLEATYPSSDITYGHHTGVIAYYWYLIFENDKGDELVKKRWDELEQISAIKPDGKTEKYLNSQKKYLVWLAEKNNRTALLKLLK